MRGLIASILTIFNAVFWAFLFYPVLILKLLTFNRFNKLSQKIFNWIGNQWNAGNSLIARVIHGIEFDVHGLDNPEISPDKSYLIICNHQAYTDIFVLGFVLNRRVPFVKYFLKQKFIWYLPFIGICLWGLDFPFVKGYSREQLRKRPELAGEDLKRVLKVCEKYKSYPTALLNFVEGHRRNSKRTPEMEKSPYKNLLKPNGVGLAIARNILQDVLTGVLDITIVYQGDRSSFKDLFSGKIRNAKVVIEFIPISEVPLEDNPNPKALPKKMQRWLKKRWEIKDQILTRELDASTRNVNELAQTNPTEKS